MPRGVSYRLEKILRDFLWGSNASERKIHLINWKPVCFSKAKGGLGIRSLLEGTQPEFPFLNSGNPPSTPTDSKKKTFISFKPF